ncbi:hypothetical protein S83_046761, partial [Arachis hypogaea]
MALRTAGRKPSFDVLRHRDDDDAAAVPISRAESDPTQTTTTRKSRKQRRNKKKKDQKLLESSPNGSACNGFELGARKFYSTGSVTSVDEEDSEESAASVCTGPATEFNFGELRQRAVNSGSSEDLANSAAVAVDGGGKDDGGAKASPIENPKLTNENDRNGGVAKLETVESLDWRRVMAEDVFLVDKSPLAYFLEEMHNGNSLRSTTLGNEKNETESMTLSFACHGDANWYTSFSRLKHANKNHDDHLEASKDKAFQEVVCYGIITFWLLSYYELWSHSSAAD